MKVYVARFKSCDDGCWGDIVAIYSTREKAEKAIEGGKVSEFDVL
jgi:hypothetical protein